MSVYTSVSADDARAYLKHYTLGHLTELKGISEGIENSNFFLTTSHAQYVLTLFEKLTAEQLPYYIGLMAHLAKHGIPCPLPMERVDGQALGELNGKPACIITKLRGRPIEAPGLDHCAQVGELLAEMHLAGQSYGAHLANWRGLSWWPAFVSQAEGVVPDDILALARSELAHQQAQPLTELPRGVIHGDLFRDNVLFDGERISGVIDFYFACDEALLFDLAVTVNDWCVRADATLDPERVSALLNAYAATRDITAAEQARWQDALRAAAFRSWLGRLGYTYFPQAGEMTHTKDHDFYRRLLENHRGCVGSMAGLP